MQLIIDAKKDSELSSFVKRLLVKAQTVVMYRSTPSQKAQVVKMVMSNLKHNKTLAIGDGANDINMI